MTKRTFRTQYDRYQHALACRLDTGRTQSEFKDDCDINKIMARYKKTGQLPQFSDAQKRFGDFTQIPSYQEMHAKLAAANEMFDALPAKVRAQYGNNPHEFIAQADTPEGRKVLVALGLGKPSELSLEPAKPLIAGAGGASPSPAGQAEKTSHDATESPNQAQQPSKKGK